MYAKPLATSVETSVANASCCRVGGGVGPASVGASDTILRTPGVVLGPISTGLCSTGRPFPTCTNPLTAAVCVVSVSAQTPAFSVAGVTISGISAGLEVSGLP